jgi:hypothetical protein
MEFLIQSFTEQVSPECQFECTNAFICGFSCVFGCSCFGLWAQPTDLFKTD